ncbi:MAG: hypothetical protein QOK48_2668 [Blastocatellia bacterium]|jgi:hypothetical protein|nr:hypothetical protein [Blastocatellia bacterium]
MKKIVISILGLLVIVPSVFGQERRAANEKELPAMGEVRIQEPSGPAQLPMANFSFITSEFSFDRLVKGAPYSAQAVTESTQTLSDGNRIVNTRTAAVYRDGEGRTRREQSVTAIGPFLPSIEPMKTILIYDPVSGISYNLDPANHIARKNASLRMEAGATTHLRTQSGAVTGGQEQNFVFLRTPNPEMQGGAVAGAIKMRSDTARTDVKQEDLGTQTIEGVSAQGSRTTITLPAGTIGNERPIDIVEERWFSKDLQTVIMTKRSDPRSGEVIYRLTNIDRSEPDHSLFEVPAGYTIREEEPMRFKFDLPVKHDEQ